ncbi:hypothetical protein POKO110462_21690 [Pontibacter korlensis]|uniref:Uncharacterized protein n=1 Tax=Pontibacter korlensis TaxID=400092 RepID=A0A0E3ZGY6_9BACT|nr:hypothetical protein [Pontibacter korlensis]AKD05184.1 hypothetical protein PKOR_21590 [Pontibacter korlensis]
MENLIEYLDESLVPLEEKVKEYLNLEKDIRKLEVDILTKQKGKPLAQISEEKASDEDLEQLNKMLLRLNELRQEVVLMLPEKNKFIEVNLGYGPSMVGYFTIDHETHQPLPEPVLRVVH